MEGHEVVRGSQRCGDNNFEKRKDIWGAEERVAETDHRTGKDKGHGSQM